MSCKYQMERDVNQILWYSVFDEDGEYSYGKMVITLKTKLLK